ncbi:hypothetical protein E4U58_001381, partial [Claviceps cyperi]
GPVHRLTSARLTPDPTNGLSNKEDAAAALRENLPDADAVVYSDGSKESGDDAGFGCVVYRDGTVVASSKGRLARSEVYDGEVWGALVGLQAAPPLDIDVLLDNTAAI